LLQKAILGAYGHKSVEGKKKRFGDINMVSFDSKFHDWWRQYKINEILDSDAT